MAPVQEHISGFRPFIFNPVYFYGKYDHTGHESVYV